MCFFSIFLFFSLHKTLSINFHVSIDTLMVECTIIACLFVVTFLCSIFFSLLGSQGRVRRINEEIHGADKSQCVQARHAGDRKSDHSTTDRSESPRKSDLESRTTTLGRQEIGLPTL